MEDTDRRGYWLQSGPVPGETFSKTFRVFDMRDGHLERIIVGTRAKATKWTKDHSIVNPDISFAIKNGALPCGTWNSGQKISG